MKKLFLTILIILFITGCSANYNLEIDKNFKFKESLEVITDKSNFEIAYNSVNDGIKDNYNKINNLLSYSLYEYKIRKGFDNVYVNFSNKYKTTYSLLESPFLKNTNAKIETYESEKGNRIFQILVDYDFYDWISTNKYVTVPISELNFNIVFPYKVISSNADSVEGNILTWNLKKLVKQRSFYIEYDESNLYKNNNYIWLFAIISVFLVGMVTILIIKNKKKSEI